MTSILDDTIQQLRTYCPPFGGRVAGAADFAHGLKNYNATMPLPAAYVVPLDQESDGNKNLTGLWQIVHKTIGVVVELDAQPDRRGQAPAMDYAEIETALFAAVLNWQPPSAECRVPNQQGYYFSGGRFLDLDRARLFYQWEFAIAWQITDEDGWQNPVDAEPLRSIELDIHLAPLEEHPDPAAVVVIITNDDDAPAAEDPPC